jgi:hypothetical protein
VLDKKLDEYVTRVENDAYELGISVGKHQERERIYQQILDIDPEGTYSEGWCEFIVESLRQKDERVNN